MVKSGGLSYGDRDQGLSLCSRKAPSLKTLFKGTLQQILRYLILGNTNPS